MSTTLWPENAFPIVAALVYFAFIAHVHGPRTPKMRSGNKKSQRQRIEYASGLSIGLELRDQQRKLAILIATHRPMTLQG